ncbi:unnamed protein product [Protopolystoma xenopodis]|uniref:Uncharacterized protein n=1 Tax=Protopolystoma xenopodis TaxID=117903 RepID=A0A3S5FCI1_9PLAT|nr:unnamed protein product [Protopolystoma xenopodis]
MRTHDSQNGGAYNPPFASPPPILLFPSPSFRLAGEDKSYRSADANCSDDRANGGREEGGGAKDGMRERYEMYSSYFV